MPQISRIPARGLLFIALIATCPAQTPKRIATRGEWRQIGHGSGYIGYNPREQTMSSTSAPNLEQTRTLTTLQVIVDPVAIFNGVAYVDSIRSNERHHIPGYQTFIRWRKS
jgi:hypothetical protein